MEVPPGRGSGSTQLKSTCGPRAMLSCFTIKRAKDYVSNWFNCLIVCSYWVKSGEYYSKKACEFNAVMKRKESNCVGILSDQGKAATALTLFDKGFF